jgi:hypothetical protein
MIDDNEFWFGDGEDTSFFSFKDTLKEEQKEIENTQAKFHELPQLNFELPLHLQFSLKQQLEEVDKIKDIEELKSLLKDSLRLFILQKHVISQFFKQK